MQANNGSIIATVIICAVLVGAFGWWVNPEVPEVEIPEGPTAEQVAAAIAPLIVIPEAPTIDTAKVDRVCELTDGCEYWEARRPILWVDEVLGEEEDVEDALLDLLNLDEDDLEDNYPFGRYDVFEVVDKETQVRDYSEDYEAGDGNWEVKIFARVIYEDVDENDEDYEYVVITSVFDEGEYDELSIEKVDRKFEFD